MFSRVCLQNGFGYEMKRFLVLDEWLFEGNSQSYCPKKTWSTGSKRILFRPKVFFRHTLNSVSGIFLGSKWKFKVWGSRLHTLVLPWTLHLGKNCLTKIVSFLNYHSQSQRKALVNLFA